MPNIETLSGLAATALDKVSGLSASSIQSISGQDLVTFTPAIYSTVNSNLSAGTWTIPDGASYLSIVAMGAGGGTANYANVNASNNGNNHPQGGGGGAGASYSGSVSTANFNTVNISIGAGAVATSGGTTTVNFGNTTLTANGGVSGGNNPGGNNAAGGTASGGNVNLTGGVGGTGATQADGRLGSAMYGCGGGGTGGTGQGSNTNHYYANGGSTEGYGNTAPQNSINAGSVVFQAYIFGGVGHGGGAGGYHDGGNRGFVVGNANPGWHRYANHSNTINGISAQGGVQPHIGDPFYTDGGLAHTAPLSLGYGNQTHANNTYATRKGGGGCGGGGAYGANYNQPVINGTGNASLSSTVGGLPQSGAVVIYAYASE